MHRRGDGGSNIRALQTVLTELGYDTGIDGDFGPKTEKVIRDLQKAAGVGADGIVGPKTVEVINGLVRKREEEQEAMRAKLAKLDAIPSATVSAAQPVADAAKAAAPAAKPAVTKKF